VDAKGMVVLPGVTMCQPTTAEELLALFDEGNLSRKVGSTKMNAESSRSHSIFRYWLWALLLPGLLLLGFISICNVSGSCSPLSRALALTTGLLASVLLETKNHTTKKTAVGKFSLIDLAGSERVGKTGATAERLKEAQNINKSLSALGDVISALSTNEKHIPYRNNKLTQLMQDSLGGNAKTLMFVNISPADYNVDETTTSLTYASRVKLITNDASKSSEGAEVTRLKKIITNLRNGGDGEIDGD
jgi:hypothetical protein